LKTASCKKDAGLGEKGCKSKGSSQEMCPILMHISINIIAAMSGCHLYKNLGCF